jgi:AraC family transcriptional regulator of adaptative response / DNA-3-methyladenine glycosylase II
MSRFTLIGPDGKPRDSATPGTLGGHRKSKVYGRLDCPGALRWIAKGHYVQHRVFFADEATALAAGFRPCGHCLRERHREFKTGALIVRLDARRPFDAEHLVGFLDRRAVPGVEEVDGATYRRDGFELVVDDGGATLTARGDVQDLVRRARAMLDLDADPAAIAARLDRDPVLPFRPGIRSPGAFDPHEVAVRAIVGQQVSVAGARTTLAKLAARGLFPQPDLLARAGSEDLPMPRTRGQALVDLANGKPLAEIKGVGPWTLAYVAMRTGDPDVFLPTDLVVRHALERLGGAVDDAERWRPFRSYAVHQLWTDQLENG